MKLLIKSIKPSIIRLDKENALYRGKIISLRSHIPHGTLGRYKVGKSLFESQLKAKKHIDVLCLENDIESFMGIEEQQGIIDEWSD